MSNESSSEKSKPKLLAPLANTLYARFNELTDHRKFHIFMANLIQKLVGAAGPSGEPLLVRMVSAQIVGLTAESYGRAAVDAGEGAAFSVVRSAFLGHLEENLREFVSLYEEVEASVPAAQAEAVRKMARDLSIRTPEEAAKLLLEEAMAERDASADETSAQRITH